MVRRMWLQLLGLLRLLLWQCMSVGEFASGRSGDGCALISTRINNITAVHATSLLLSSTPFEINRSVDGRLRVILGEIALRGRFRAAVEFRNSRILIRIDAFIRVAPFERVLLIRMKGVHVALLRMATRITNVIHRRCLL